jgi:D-aminoacyl-tRNA deacylase
MNIVIVLDENDTASMNIKERLLEQNIFAKTSMKFKNDLLYSYRNAYLLTNTVHSAEAENVDEDIAEITSIKPDLIIFPTVHSSQSGIPSLTVHTQGNWGIAELGGLDKRLGFAAEPFLKEGLQYMFEQQKKYPSLSEFDVIQEATHHGPVLNTPSMFIEIGSTPQEWKNSDAGKLLADTIVYLIDSSTRIQEAKYETIVGIGGTHSCKNFKKIMLFHETYALGHVCPKYALELLDETMIRQALKNSMHHATKVMLDWKGMGKEKERILTLLADMHITYERTKDFSFNTEE